MPGSNTKCMSFLGIIVIAPLNTYRIALPRVIDDVKARWAHSELTGSLGNIVPLSYCALHRRTSSYKICRPTWLETVVVPGRLRITSRDLLTLLASFWRYLLSRTQPPAE